MISGQGPPFETSLTKATVNEPEQLSASSNTTLTSGVGISSAHSTASGAGLDAVGEITSPTTILCVTRIWFQQSSVMLYVLVIVSGQVAPSLTSSTNATTGIEQLSDSSVTSSISVAGTLPLQ